MTVVVRKANTILYTDRWRDTVAFYRDVLQLPVAMTKEWFIEFRLDQGSFLSVADAGRATIAAGSGAGITLSWQVDDVLVVRDRLLGLGLAPTPVREHPWGALAFFLHDPAGNRIECWSPLEPDGI